MVLMKKIEECDSEHWPAYTKHFRCPNNFAVKCFYLHHCCFRGTQPKPKRKVSQLWLTVNAFFAQIRSRFGLFVIIPSSLMNPFKVSLIGNDYWTWVDTGQDCVKLSCRSSICHCIRYTSMAWTRDFSSKWGVFVMFASGWSANCSLTSQEAQLSGK